MSEQEGQYGSQWAAIKSGSGKTGCTAETLRSWIGQSERERLKQLEKENKELERAKLAGQIIVPHIADNPIRALCRARASHQAILGMSQG